MATKKTYRVLHDGMRVGDEVRYFGDYMPEAESFPNIRAYLNSGFLEVVHIDEEVLEKWKTEYAERQNAEADTDDEVEVEEDTETESEVEEEEEQEPESVVAPKKTVRKRKAVKKPAKSKEKESVSENGLEEHAV